MPNKKLRGMMPGAPTGGAGKGGAKVKKQAKRKKKSKSMY